MTLGMWFLVALLVVCALSAFFGIRDDARKNRALAAEIDKMVADEALIDISKWHPISVLMLKCHVQARGAIAVEHGRYILIQRVAHHG